MGCLSFLINTCLWNFFISYFVFQAIKLSDTLSLFEFSKSPAKLHRFFSGLRRPPSFPITFFVLFALSFFIMSASDDSQNRNISGENDESIGDSIPNSHSNRQSPDEMPSSSTISPPQNRGGSSSLSRCMQRSPPRDPATCKVPQ